MEIILATGNAHKAEEFQEILKSTPIKIKAAPDKLDPDETGTTFIENAFIKAHAYYQKYQKPILSDDSGLVVTELPNILGVASARFAPETPDYKDKCAKVLKLTENLKNKQAYFVCYLCLYLKPEEVYFFEGRVHGQIGTQYKGDKGFGYDPIFEPEGQNGKSLAELPEWKNTNSHRAKAISEMQNFLLERVLQSP